MKINKDISIEFTQEDILEILKEKVVDLGYEVSDIEILNTSYNSRSGGAGRPSVPGGAGRPGGGPGPGGMGSGPSGRGPGGPSGMGGRPVGIIDGARGSINSLPTGRDFDNKSSQIKIVFKVTDSTLD